MKNPWVVVGILTIILFGGAIWYSSAASKASNEGVEVVGEHIKGNPEAAVTLTEYSDFQCPACAGFEPVVASVLNSYGDKIRFEYKHYPLPIHPFAQQAAVAAEAAGQQDKFFEYHDKLFANQKAWTGSKTPQTFFIRYAEELGLDVSLFKQHLKSSLLKDAVRDDLNEAQDMGLTGTPTFFLNGQRMEMESYEDFVAQIVAAVDPQAALQTASSTEATTTAPTTTQGVKFGI